MRVDLRSELRVLYVESSPGRALAVRAAFAGVSTYAVEITMVAHFQEALDRVAVSDFEVILLDPTVPDGHGMDAAHILHDQAPSSALVLLLDRADAEIAQQEPFECVFTDQITRSVLVHAIHCAIERVRESETDPLTHKRKFPGRVIAFIGAKGGVGTTTTLISVGTALALQQKSVVALELRPSFGTFSCHLKQLSSTLNLPHLLDSRVKRFLPSQLTCRLEPVSPGFLALCGPQGCGEFHEIAADRSEALVTGLAELADYVLVDLPLRPSAASRALVQRCDHTVLVVNADPICLSSARVTAQLLAMWGSGKARLSTVLVDRGGAMTEVGPLDLVANLGIPVSGSVPCLTSMDRDSQSQTGAQEPATSESAGVHAAIWLADELIAEVEMQRLRVMLMEPNPADAQEIRKLLMESPTPRFDVLEPTDSDEALRSASAGDFDLVLMACGPEGAEHRLLARLVQEAPSSPVVVLLSLDDDRASAECMRQGASECLLKSKLDGYWLVKSVCRMVESQRRLVALAQKAREGERREMNYRRSLGEILRQRSSDPRMV